MDYMDGCLNFIFKFSKIAWLLIIKQIYVLFYIQFYIFYVCKVNMDVINMVKWFMIILMGSLYVLWFMQFISKDWYEKYKMYY